MPKIVTKGVGLMQRKVEIINAADDPDAFHQAMEAFASRPSADAHRDANAKHVRESLERAAAKRGMHVKQFVATLTEDQAYRIFWDWLCVYNRLSRERAKSQPDMALVVEHAEELGKIHERHYWRAGVDPDTRERREALALQARRSRLARPRATEIRREKAARRRSGGDHAPDEKLAWRLEAIEHAREVRSRFPTYKPSGSPWKWRASCGTATERPAHGDRHLQ